MESFLDVMPMPYPNLTLTFLIQCDGRYLLIRRSESERNFPGLWAFPGGKVEEEETVVDTLLREVREETGLRLDGFFIPLNSYCFPGSVGIAFLVRSIGSDIKPSGFTDYRWVERLSELSQLRCIPGIHNHLADAIRESERGHWRSMEDFKLTEDKYINR